MTRPHTIAFAAAVLAGLAIPAVFDAGTASAAPAGNGVAWQTTIDDAFDEVIEDFCDVPGLTVELAFTSVGTFRYTSPGVAGLPYFTQFADDTEVYTNVDTGASVTLLNDRRSKDVRVTDNGDGTLTFIVVGTGHGFLYSEEGDTLGRSAGMFSYRVVYNYAGTPTDPSDDFKVGRPTILKDVGLKPDFCGPMVEAIG